MKKASDADFKKTFLKNFINDKILKYVEPQRRGTPKGNPIGLSKVKYNAAALCSLTKTSVKEIANQLDVSYGLLRKWRTEDKFYEVVDELEREFCQLLVEHLKKRGEKQLQLRDEYFSKTLDEMIKTYPPFINWDEFVDIKNYSEAFMLLIVGTAGRYLENLKKEIEAAGYDDINERQRLQLSIESQCHQFFMNTMHYSTDSVEEFQNKFGDVISKQSSNMQSLNYNISLAILKKGTLTEDDRKTLVYIAHDLAGKYSFVKMDY